MDQTNNPSYNPADLTELEELERIQRVWNERALQLAKVDTGDEDLGEQITVVLLRLGRELIGLDVQYVYDIRAREAITRVPRVPGWVVGVTNLRGNILSVIDLCRYFGLPHDVEDGGQNHGLLVIVQDQTMEIVFLVDDVLGVETLPVRENATTSGLIHSLRPEYIHFIGERTANGDKSVGEDLTQRHVVVLNVENLLADQRLVVHDEIA